MSLESQIQNNILEIRVITHQFPELLAGIVSEQIHGLSEKVNEPSLKVITGLRGELSAAGESKSSHLKKGLTLIEIGVAVPGNLQLEGSSINKMVQTKAAGLEVDSAEDEDDLVQILGCGDVVESVVLADVHLITDHAHLYVVVRVLGGELGRVLELGGVKFDNSGEEVAVLEV